MQAEMVVMDRLSRGDIKAKVEQLWHWLFPARPLPREYPVDDIARELERRRIVRLEMEQDLPTTRDGRQCYGEFTVAPRKRIRLHRSLRPGSARFTAMLGHEIGHLVLHRKYLSPSTYISTLRPAVTPEARKQFGSFGSFSDLDWAEWQANEFMLCLLLPREGLILRVMKKQLELDLPVGPLYVDEQGCNQVAAGQVIAGIAMDLMIQTPLVEARMRQMGLIRDVRPKERPHFAGSSAKDIFAQWTSSAAAPGFSESPDNHVGLHSSPNEIA